MSSGVTGWTITVDSGGFRVMEGGTEKWFYKHRLEWSSFAYVETSGIVTVAYCL